MNTDIIKKLLCAALSVTMIVSAAAVIPVVGNETGITANAAEEGTSVTGDYWNYIYYPDGTAKITQWHTSHNVWNASHTEQTEVKHTDYPVVPAYINNFKVTSIGRGAFGVYYNESSVSNDGTVIPITIKGAKGVTLPETVTEIDDMAFLRNINLTSVTLPESLEKIGMEAFMGCVNLNSIVLPDNLNTINSYAFCETGIASVHIKTTLQNWARAFEGCEYLSDVRIDEGIKEIPNYAFNNCSSLSEIKLPSSLETLGRFAFSHTALKSVKIPDTMTSLGGAFINCAELTQINIPDGVTELCPNEFNGCTSLENIVLPAGLKTINSPYAFSETAIKTITIPAGVKEISYGSFYGCDSLERVVFKGNITKIGELAFANCGSLKTLTPAEIKATIGRCAFSNCKSLKSVTLGKNTAVPSDSGIGFWYNKETSATEKIPDFKIYCYEGSYGEQYAKDNEFDYENIYEVTGVTLDKSQLNLTTGNSATLTASVSPDNAYDKTVSWTTSNSNVATVSNGKVKAVSAGTATITVKTSNGKKAICTVTVKNPVIEASAVSLNKTAMKLTSGNSETLAATITPANATDKSVTWTTSNSKVATVSSGKVTAISAGTAKITAKTNNGKTASCTVTVVNPTVDVTGISLNKTSASVTKGNSLTLTATITPSNATNKSVTWTTSNSKVATVSNGKVTAIAAGTAKITAKTNNGKTAVCTVTVKNPAVAATSIKLDKTSTTLGKGETITLKATIAPSDTTNKTVTWTTSNSSVVTVSNGSVTAKNNGTATITARTSNGKTATCKITVRNAPTKITLTKGILTIGVGESYTLGSGIDEGAGCATRKYRTSNSSIVRMTRTDWNGVFTGVKPGVAYVTVRTYNGKESTCKVTVKAAPSSVTISKKNLTLKVGQTATLSCSVPSNAGCATRTFRTSNASVVKMTKTNWTGSFKAMKPGVAYVTVRTYNGKESTCKVTVVK